MPVPCPSLLTYFQWHGPSPSLRSIFSSCLPASRTWLFLYSCCLCLSVCAGTNPQSEAFKIHFPSADLTFDVSLHSYGCYLLGSVEGGSQSTYDTCPNYGSTHRGANQSGAISESSAFNYELLIAAIKQTRKYPNLYNSSNVTVSCDHGGCNITRFDNSSNPSAGCSSHSFSFAEDAMSVLAQLYLPPALLLAIALLLAT
uniref:Minor glycoprotein n=1 Tax=Kibale red colobus virus 1 TaxID=1885929 RepID=X2D783_9NIDO|nr:minor glycoprotein [Kibale red colobus virus 1]